MSPDLIREARKAAYPTSDQLGVLWEAAGLYADLLENPDATLRRFFEARGNITFRSDDHWSRFKDAYPEEVEWVTRALVAVGVVAVVGETE